MVYQLASHKGQKPTVIPGLTRDPFLSLEAEQKSKWIPDQVRDDVVYVRSKSAIRSSNSSANAAPARFTPRSRCR
jgi:hypothetical protein